VTSFTRGGRALGLWLALPLVLAAAPASALQSLDDFLASSRTGNLDRQEAQITAAQRADEARQAKSRLAPTLVARAGYTRNERETTIPNQANPTGDPITITPRDQLDASFTLSLPLVDVGAWQRIGAAGDTAEAARLRAAGAADEAEKSVSRAYFQVVAAEATLVAARQALATALEGQTITGRRMEAGTASELEVERDKAAVARARQVVASADQARLVARRSLETLSGLRPSEGTVPLPDDALVAEPALAALEPAVARLPAVRAAALDARAAERNADAAWAALYPSLAASATEKLSNATGFAGHVSTWSLGVTATWSLDPSTYFAARAQSTARAAADLRARRSEIAARDELFNAFQEVSAQIVRSQAAQAEAQASARAARLARDRLEAGSARQLDVLQADRDAFNAEVGRIQAAADLAYARALLRITSGRGVAAKEMGR
jgi:outer membrane protein TolC